MKHGMAMRSPGRFAALLAVFLALSSSGAYGAGAILTMTDVVPDVTPDKLWEPWKMVSDEQLIARRYDEAIAKGQAQDCAALAEEAGFLTLATKNVCGDQNAVQERIGRLKGAARSCELAKGTGSGGGDVRVGPVSVVLKRLDPPLVPPTNANWPTVSDGTIKFSLHSGDHFVGSEYTWNSPGDIGPAGIPVTLTVTCTTAKINTHSTGIGIRGHNVDIFVNGTRTAGGHTEVPVNCGRQQSLSASVTVQVVPRANYAEGEAAYLEVGAFFGPGVKYRYTAKETGPAVGKPKPPPPPPPIVSRPPAAGAVCNGFGGNWNSDYGPISLSVQAGRASGDYPNHRGTIDATVTGNVLEGRWIQPDRSGRLRFVLSADGQRFGGTWTEASGGGGGTWNGVCRGQAASAGATPPPQQAKAPRFLGCFKDPNNPFDLDGYLERSAQNTPQRCISLCKDKGFAYAGVQYGESCLCGNSYGKYGPANNCNFPCTGDSGQICGGHNANNVYPTGVVVAAPPPKPPSPKPPPIAKPEPPKPPVVKPKPPAPPVDKPEPPIAKPEPPPVVKPEPPPPVVEPPPPPPVVKPEPPIPPIAKAEPPAPPVEKPEPPPPPKPEATGDCDGDGRMTALDARCALEMSVQLTPVQIALDMDESKDVTSRDATLILQRAVGK